MLGAIGAGARVMRRRLFVLGVGSVEQERGLLAGVLRSDDAVEERGIMVLLEKQVHLQKDVGAGWALVRCQAWRGSCTYKLRETRRGRRGREGHVSSSTGP